MKQKPYHQYAALTRLTPFQAAATHEAIRFGLAADPMDDDITPDTQIISINDETSFVYLSAWPEVAKLLGFDRNCIPPTAVNQYIQEARQNRWGHWQGNVKVAQQILGIKLAAGVSRELGNATTDQVCVRTMEYIIDDDDNSPIVWPEVDKMANGTACATVGRLVWIAHDTVEGCLSYKEKHGFRPLRNDFDCLRRMTNLIQNEMSSNEVKHVANRVRQIMEEIRNTRREVGIGET